MCDMKNKYRITTDGNVFRIELYRTWTYRAGWFFLKKVTKEEWVPCDCVGGDCCDEDGCFLDEEVVYYDTLEEAKNEIEAWTYVPALPHPSVWSVVWP